MKDAIKKAIEGGYDIAPFISVWSLEQSIEIMESHWEPHVLKPTFWQALGKSMGWEEENHCERFSTGGLGGNVDCLISEWHAQMLMFIDHLAEGKDVDSFFNSLLK